MFLQNTGCLAAEQAQLFFGACPKYGMVQEKGLIFLSIYIQQQRTFEFQFSR